MSDDKTRAAPQGVKFSQFKEVGPDPANKLQVVGLKSDENVRADLTTELVSTNSAVVFRDAKGRFKSIDDLPELNNQLEVNRFLLEELERLHPESRTIIFAEDEPTEYPHAEDDEPNDLEAGDQWYQVIDPGFDYDNPDPEGLDLFVWTDVDGTFEWVLVEPPVEYVKKKGGDEMEGPLVILRGPVILKTEGVEDDEVVTKKYIDDKASFLQGEIVDLEEEIEAIIPSVERGAWKFASAGAVTGPGIFTAYDQPIATSGNPTGLYQDIKSIWFHSTDSAGIYHSFGNVKEDNLLELFENGSDDYGLYEVTAVHDQTDGAGDYWVIDVNFVRTLVATDRIEDGDTCRLKIFNAPDGGTADGFVLKSGDTMTGDLNIDKSAESTDAEAILKLKGNRSSTTNSAATIKFDNEQSTAKGYLTYRAYGAGHWFAFNQDVDLSNNGLHSVARIRMKPDGGIGSGNNTRLTFHNASSGNEGEGLLVVPRPSDNRRGFTIRGNNADGVEQDMLYTYTNYSGTPDAINYNGKMDSGQNLVNKAYVDASATEVLIGDTCKWKRGGLEESTLEGYKYFGIEKAGTTSSQVGYGNVLYLNKLIAIDGTLQSLENYKPTDGSLIEVWSGNELWFKSLLNPTTYKVAGRNSNEIVCDFTTKYPVVSKPSFNWSGSTTYKIILTGMVKK